MLCPHPRQPKEPKDTGKNCHLPSLPFLWARLFNFKSRFCFQKVYQTGICSNSSKPSQEKFQKVQTCMAKWKEQSWRKAWEYTASVTAGGPWASFLASPSHTLPIYKVRAGRMNMEVC